MSTKSDASLVNEFTKASGFDVPDKPVVMSRENVHFITKMIIDELTELMATVDEPKDYVDIMTKMVKDAKPVTRNYDEEHKKIADQADALVDIYYYSLNSASKHGVNLSKIFQLVHQANMDKRDPVTLVFNRREDGKIIKPANWKEPDINEEILRQQREGAWNE